MSQERASVEPMPMIVRWPVDALWRGALRSEGVPRLLLVEPGTVPPAVDGATEDWAWATADERDVFARLHWLGVRSRRRLPVRSHELVVGPDGVLAVGDARTFLPPVEARMMSALIERVGRLCTRRALEAAAWGAHPRGAGALSSRIFTLRSRITPLGLSIHTVRGEGYTLNLLPSEGRRVTEVHGGTTVERAVVQVIGCRRGPTHA
ncbi:MAG TPA: helix-turn-helix domain-containing protein [Nocardioides sp.]